MPHCTSCASPILPGFENTAYSNSDSPKIVCSRCLERTNTKCDICGKHYDNLALNYFNIDNTRKAVCNHCYRANFYRCDNCNVRFANITNPPLAIRGHLVCPTCVSNYVPCPRCNALVRKSSIVEFLGEHICEQCRNTYLRGAGVMIHSSEYRPAPIFHTIEGETDKIFLGVELETERNCSLICNSSKLDEIAYEFRKKYSQSEKLFYLKYDGSLNYGFEVVSHPGTLGWHLSVWDEWLEYLKSRGMLSAKSPHCGLHIHVNRNYFTPSSEIKLGLFMHSNKENVIKIARRSSSYALFKNDSPTNIVRLGKKIKDKPHKYEAVNWLHSNSIELRVFKGTLKSETLKASLEFTHAASSFVKKNGITKFTDPQKTWGLFSEHVTNGKYLYLPDYMKTRGVL